MNTYNPDRVLKLGGAHSLLLSGAAFAVLLGSAGNALAQTDAPAPSAPSEDAATPSRDDIVVTARRTEEKLSEVPVSVAALGAQALQERRILTETDLQAATPGLTVRQVSSSNQLNFSLRGQSLDAFSFASPAVLTYVNEFNAQGVAAGAFFDLQSIQVLKGPQGTLFGRNATGGAVLYQTQRPEDEFGGYAKAGYGNYDARLLEGAINLPLGEFGAFRVAAQRQKRDGYQRNLLLGTRNASVDNFSIRPSLLLNIGDRIENLTMFQYTFTGGNSAGLKVQNIYEVGQMNGSTPLVSGIPTSLLYNPGSTQRDPRVAAFGFDGIADYLAKQNSQYGYYDIFNNQTGRHRARQYTVTNTTTFELSDDMTLKNVFGYNRARSRDLTDIDGSPYEPLVIGQVAGETAEGYTYLQRQISDEIQLSGNAADDKLKYIAGLYYFSGLDYQRIPLSVAPDVETSIITDLLGLPGGPLATFLRSYQVKSKSKAVYAQLTYALTDRLNATVGGRYSWEKTNYRPVSDGVPGFDPLTDDANIGVGVGPESMKESKPSWSISLDYKVTDDLLLYAAHRGSWRTGGFNGTATSVVDGVTVANRFDPETTYDFEVGAKFNGVLGTMPTTFNIAVYDQYIKNVIRAIYTGVSAVSGNVGKARVTGVEADLSVRPTDWLQLGGTLAYTHARYTDPIAFLNNTNYTFGPYGDVPKWTGSAFARLSHDLANDGGEIALRGDFYAQSKFYYTNAADTILPGTVIDGYHTIDARLEWSKVMGTGISLAGWIKNITDKKYSVGGFGLGAVNAINATLPGLPRTYGVEASFKF